MGVGRRDGLEGTRFSAVLVFTNLTPGSPPTSNGDDGGVLRVEAGRLFAQARRGGPWSTSVTSTVARHRPSELPGADPPFGPEEGLGDVELKLQGPFQNVENASGPRQAAAPTRAGGRRRDGQEQGSRRSTGVSRAASSASTKGQPFTVLVDYAHYTPGGGGSETAPAVCGAELDRGRR